ncbi:MAG: hypothetical protein M1830_005783 [Pleopsidium flavum]|nr:MAG: hypothetical protein M1830_005783 [Pleopsidium flavum]
MDFRKKLMSTPPSSSGGNNTSSSSITQLPANILEAFIPGYSIISKFLLDVLGFDISLVVSVCFLIFALGTSTKFLWKHAFAQFSKYFMSSISIDSDDDIYDHVMAWLAEQHMSQVSRSLMAKTGKENAWDSAEDRFGEDDMDTSTLFNFSNWDAKIPPRFEPYFGQHRFWHKRQLFFFDREMKQVLSSGWGGSTFKEDETIKLTCIGRSTQPIKKLILECRETYLEKENSRTVVRRPSPKESRMRGRNVWTRVATRPSRPMETVVLDHDQKARILADINEYLHPATPRWYANRGIPYRRGYLFHGPPGTGKTSLSFSISGIFGLDIYCISLLEPTLTEEDLGLLFSNLPRRCVVLLEDIDSAGLIRREERAVEEAAEASVGHAEIGAEIAKAFKSVHERNEKTKNNQGISLSGLLNAIDGVASHEGRVLVMTTNFPEKLDEALIRPGRVDMKVEFTMATRSQIRELFIRMYSSDAMKPTKQMTNRNFHRAVGRDLDEKMHIGDSSANSGASTPVGISRNSVVPLSELKKIADEFASCLPEGKFTPAEIQGFLLTRKKEPKRALAEVFEWRDAQLEAKAAKANASTIGKEVGKAGS